MASLHFPSLGGLAYAFNLRAPKSLKVDDAIELANNVIARANQQDPTLCGFNGEKTILSTIINALERAGFTSANLDDSAPHTAFYDGDASPQENQTLTTP